MNDVVFVRGETAAQPLFAPEESPTQKRSVMPRFFKEGRKDGNGVYQEVEMVEILIAGDRKSAAVKKVTDFVRDRWPEQYARWKRGEELSHDGTALEIWPPLADQKSLIQILKLNHIHTVEALAEIPDTALEPLGIGARKMREAARLYCDSKDDGVEQMRDENEKLRQQMAHMQAQIDSMAARGGTEEPAETSPETPVETPGETPPVVPETVQPVDWTEITPWPDRASYVRDVTGTRPKNMAEAEALMAKQEAA